VVHEIELFPHHDLFNLAYYHRCQIEQKDSDDTLEGKGLDCMACIIALGLTVEGIINFAGSTLFDDWKEHDRYHNKLKRVCESIGYEFDEKEEPLSGLKKLKELRNTFAHAKPIYRKAELKTIHELDEAMQNHWDKYLQPEFVYYIYDLVDNFEKRVYANEMIKETGILSCASGWSGELS